MSERALRRRAPVPGGRKAKPPTSSPGPSPRRSTPPSRRSLAAKPSRPVRSELTRSASAPALRRFSAAVDDDAIRSHINLQSQSNIIGVLRRPGVCTDVLASSPSLLGASTPSSPSYEGYKKDAKVVVNVTVEGSPGPIRTMVKLGSSVEETIRLVIDKYSEEGRLPKQEHRTAAVADFELHHSYFSLQSLDKSELIGDVGSRSFYLRTRSNGRNIDEEYTSVNTTQAVQVKSSPASVLPSMFLVPTFIVRKIKKIVRRTRRIWEVFVCLQ